MKKKFLFAGIIMFPIVFANLFCFAADINSVSADHINTDNVESVVYMTDDITPEGLMAVYKALDWEPAGEVAVKLSTGEPPNSNYLKPELIGELVQYVNGTIVECNTAYGGSRSSAAMHMQVAKDHGFTDIAEVDILDADGSMTLQVSGGTQLTENLVGSHFGNYDSYLVLSHFKGHAMAGFGGAIKNISIGLGSSEGKCLIHTAGKSHTSPWGSNQDAFLESMGDAGKSVSDYLGNGERIVYVNVMNRLSVDCDCNGNPAEPDMHDIGILASTDPVALDQACIDLVYAAEDSASLVSRIESRNGLHTLENAETIGLGSRKYQLLDVNNIQPTTEPTECPNRNVSMKYENGTLIISGLETEADLIQTSYKDGMLTGVRFHTAQNGTQDIKAENGDKFFLWKSIVSIFPLCPAVTVINENMSNNVLIAYFSRAGENWEVGYVEKGNTAVIADYIREKVDADIFEITPVVPYPEAYYDTLPIVQRERDNNERPEFNRKIENFDRYDTVFLGYPIWYGGLPMIMYTFLEEYDMSGKTIIPFSTHGGSGWGSTRSELNTLCPDSEFIDGFSTAGTNAKNAQAEVEKWIESLELNMNNNIENEEQAVLEALNARCKAMVEKDIDTLDELMDDSITLRHMTGITQTKQEWLDDIANGDLSYDKIEIVDPVVEINGDTATVKYTSIIAANAYGSYSDSWRLAGNSNFIRRNGKWIWC